MKTDSKSIFSAPSSQLALQLCPIDRPLVLLAISPCTSAIVKIQAQAIALSKAS